MDDILEALAAGRLSVEEARRRLAQGAIADLQGLYHLDIRREIRTGIPEVVLGEGKRPEEVRRIVERFLADRTEVLVSRLDEAALHASGLERLPGAHARYHAAARFLVMRRDDHVEPRPQGLVGILSAGTSDLAVAEEARLTAESLGVRVLQEIDVGVAAPARLAPALQRILDADPDVLIVAAGREGTLPTLVSAQVPVPVIGLPVSTGYGAGGHGMAALHTMLQSCSPLVVVNVDAGVIAGSVAARIARLARRGTPNAQGTPR